MKTSGFLSVLFFSLLLLQGCDDGESKSEVGLHADQSVFYFGIPVSKNQVYAHIYKIENISDSLIVVDRVATTCGCTSSGISEDSLFPGETATVTAFFNSIGFTHSTSRGLRVYYGEEILELSFQIDCGLVPTMLDPTPDTLIVPRDSVLTEIVFQVKNIWDEDVTISCADIYGAFYDIPTIMPSTIQPDSISEIRLIPLPEAVEEDFRPCSITLEAQSQRGSERISIAITDSPYTGLPPDTTDYPNKY